MATTIAEEVVGVLRGVRPTDPVNDPVEVEHVRQTARARSRIYRGSR